MTQKLCFLIESLIIKSSLLTIFKREMLKTGRDQLISGDDSYIPEHEKRNQKCFKRWTSEENARYLAFLELHKQQFQEEYTRRVMKVFKLLSEFVGTKTQSQCKSHHQKVMKKNDNNLDQVIQSMKGKPEDQNQTLMDKKEEVFFQETWLRKEIPNFMTVAKEQSDPFDVLTL